MSIQEQLNQPIPQDAIKVHPYSGRSYIDRHYVVDTLNRIFGNTGWSSELSEGEVLHVGKVAGRDGQERDQVVCKVHCMIRVWAVDEGQAFSRTDYGICENTANSVGECMDTAMKGAATDALKRAASQLGPALGADLYKKEGGQQAATQPRPAAPPQQRTQQPQRGGSGEVRGALTAHNSKSGTGARGPWTSNRFQINGQWFGTFDEGLAARLIPAVGTGVEVTVELAQGQKGLDLVDVIDAGDLQTQDGGWGGPDDEVL